MYGSSFMFATLRPRFSISAPIDADTMPLPSDDTTPPVTNTNLVCCAMVPRWRDKRAPGAFYRLGPVRAIGDTSDGSGSGDLRKSTVLLRHRRRFAVDQPGRRRMIRDPTRRF